MSLKKIFICFALFLLALPVLAQEESTEAENVVGPVTFVTLPDGWTVNEGPGATILIANFDLTAEDINVNNLPQDTIVAQVQLLARNRINGVGEDPTALDILSAMTEAAMPDDTQQPEISSIEGETFDFARVDVSNDQSDALAIAFNISDVTFAIVTVTTINPSGEDTLTNAEDEILAILDQVTYGIEVPEMTASAVTSDPYAGLTQGVSEDGFPTLGDPTAPVELVEIGSFDCPACRVFHEEVMPELLPRIAAGELRLTYVPVFGTGSLPDGDSAARAAICTLDSGNYWLYHDMLYSWQELGNFAFAYERLQAGAADFGVDAEAFDACYISEDTFTTLNGAIRFAQDLGDQFTGTPMLLINGGTVPNSLELINLAIDSALEQSAD